MSSSIAHALAACRTLRLLGGPIYLLHSGKTGVTWVGAMTRESVEKKTVPEEAGFYHSLRVERKPVFFLLGSKMAASRREPAHALCIRPDVELQFDSTGTCSFFYREKNPDLKVIADTALSTQPCSSTVRQPVSPEIMSGWDTEPDDMFAATMDRAIALVRGRYGKLITTRGYSRKISATRDPVDLAWGLAESEPDAPAFHYLEMPGEFASLGTSPENVLELEKGILHLDAVAGTRRVVSDAKSDAALEAELLASEKERDEHAAALGRAMEFARSLCQHDSVRVAFERRIRKLRHVRHLWSHVEGTLLEELDGPALLERAFPPLTSYPEDLAAQAELILTPPRFYGGMVGRLDADGGVRSFLNLRSVEVQPGLLLTRAGVGVVNGSTRAGETREVLSKLHAIHEAVENWI